MPISGISINSVNTESTRTAGNSANLCLTFRITKAEAFDNLYILFKANIEAGRYYKKHVLENAKSIDDAFLMMYERFMSEERRDRLLQKWNNLKFIDFENDTSDRHADLRKLCSTASTIQLQLGTSYQGDQHLPDALLNACKNEK